MIQVGTNLFVADNSGARTVQCIKVLNKPKQQMGYTGATLVVSVQSLVRKQKSKVKKGHMYRAIVCETKRMKSRADGSLLRCARNTVILLSLQNNPIGSRIQGLTPYELRVKNHMKLLSLSLANI
jgi:large subunit ribosomal protein L14|tara:strand:+ start:2121 stop:2495 length:375 start_codon:yes stop_codon:yes gene_type:complete